MGQPRPHPSVPSILGFLTCAHTARETAIKFRLVIKLGVRKLSTASTAPPVLAKNFGDTNAGAQSVCGS